MQFILSAVVLCTVVAATLADVCDTYGNGCSVPFNAPLFYKSQFTHACNCHDICYGCGAKFGVSKGTCDRRFLSDMRATCSSNGCRSAAGIYYGAVAAFGSSRYRSASNPESYCSDSRVRSRVG